MSKGKNQKNNKKRCGECRLWNKDECPYKGMVKHESIKSGCKYH